MTPPTAKAMAVVCKGGTAPLRTVRLASELQSTMAPEPNSVADVEERIDLGCRGLIRLAATCPESGLARQPRAGLCARRRGRQAAPGLHCIAGVPGLHLHHAHVPR